MDITITQNDSGLSDEEITEIFKEEFLKPDPGDYAFAVRKFKDGNVAISFDLDDVHLIVH